VGVRLVGHGHSAIRATHAKTLEVTADDTITERATCVVAVGTQAEPPAPLAGPVRITITAGDESFGLDAFANPSWDPHGAAVIRRSPLRLPGTLATEAGAAAADLPRPLVAALRDPGTRVEVRVERAPPQERIVLFAADPARRADPRLLAELAVADRVLAEDAGARTLLTRSEQNALLTAVEQSKGAPNPPLHAGRLLIIATADLPGAHLAGPDLTGVPIETVGLPARLAVAAACPSRAPLLFAPDGSDLRALLRAAPAAHRVVVTVARAELGRFLAQAERERGSGAATVAQEFAPVQRAAPDALPDLPSNDAVHCCLHPAGTATAPVLDPRTRAAVAALLDDGVATRSAARALAQLTGWSRREAYDAVLALQREQSR
jgi:hypothetical protein